ncbi:MAG: fumarate hydratase C-terminal domain-containing protein [Nitrospirae bacterium]|nr:fumarate hydratase C-terminal domain-containing protein [Nitrospirota bacterium]
MVTKQLSAISYKLSGKKATIIKKQRSAISSQPSGKKTKIINLPLTKKDVLGLKVGDVVLINGLIVTGRDKIHQFLFYEKPSKKDIPFDLSGTILFHCGPIIKKTDDGYTMISAGPTTSIRVDMYESKIISDYGIRGIIGKGGMGENTLKAMKKNGCVYLHTIGGAAAYLADKIKRVIDVWKLEEFGMPEAMWLLEVEGFPAIVTMDAHGKSLHKEIEKESHKILQRLLKM